MGNSSLLNSHALQFIGQVCSCCKGSVLLSLSLSLQCSSKIWIDGWHSKQNFPPEACSTVTAMHLPLSLLAFQKLVDRIIQAIKKRHELWKTPKTSFQMPSLCILHHWWLLFYFQYIQTHLPFRNRHNFVSRSSQSPNLLLLWSSTAKLQRTIPWRSVNGRCWSKRLKLLQLFEIQPAEMRFRGVPNSKKGEQTKSCKESWPLIYIYIYVHMYGILWVETSTISRATATCSSTIQVPTALVLLQYYQY